MGKRNDFGFLSLSSSFLVFEFFSLLLLKAWDDKDKRRGESESFALSLFVANKKYLWKYLTKAKKKKKSILSSRKKIFSLCSLCLKGGRASSLLRRRRRHHQPSLWNTEQHEKKESREQHEDAKIPTSGGERKCCWAFYWSREVCVCARFPPLISLRKAYFIGLFFRQFFFVLVGKLPFWNLPFLSDFFFCRFGKKGTKRRKNQHKKSLRREYVERRRLSLRNTLLQKEGRIDLERFFLVENFQRRGERKFALRRVERKREREKGDFNFFQAREKGDFPWERPSVFFIRTSLCARIEREKRGREGTWICVYAFELNRI